jgi:hypothetical protein
MLSINVVIIIISSPRVAQVHDWRCGLEWRGVQQQPTQVAFTER